MSHKARHHIHLEIARAEAVIASASGNFKQHEPTIENHRGQLLAFRKIGHILDHEEIMSSEPIRIERDPKISVSWPCLVVFYITIFLFLVL